MGRRKGIAAAAVWCFLAMIALSACSDTAPSDKASKDTAAYPKKEVSILKSEREKLENNRG